jgi:hypothetical protein
MQIRFSFTSVILAGRYERKTAPTRHNRNAQKKTHILTAESRMAE